MAHDLHDELLQVIKDLSFARDLPTLTTIVRTAARRLTQADGVTFVLKDDGECFYADEDAIAPLWKGKRFPLSACVSGWVMTHGETAVIPDIYADPRVPQDAYRATFVQSLAMVPVRQTDPVAALGAYWARHHEATRTEVDVLQRLAESASLALINVSLWTEQARVAERERAARVEAEQLNELKDHFLANVSHELRTPLNVIQGWIWQLRQPHTPPAVMSKALDALDRNVRRQTQLVEDLLDTSRAMAGDLTLQPRLLDVTGVCRVVLELARPMATEKGLTLNLQIDSAVSPLIRADMDRLQQIVWNLVSNAIKFTPRGGTVTIEVGRSDHRVAIVVRDTGVGIAPDFLPFMFDRFRQQDSSTTRSYGGLGIGLAIVQQLVRLHGGTITAQSAGAAQGTTITVEFPIPAVVSEPGDWLQRGVGAPGGTARLDGLSILVVDDEPDACEALKQILEAHGARVSTASSGSEALSLLEEMTPSVVLADLAMPGMDGFTFLRRVRERRAPTAHVPVAALTAFSGEDYQRRAAEAGF